MLLFDIDNSKHLGYDLGSTFVFSTNLFVKLVFQFSSFLNELVCNNFSYHTKYRMIESKYFYSYKIVRDENELCGDT